MKTNDKPRKKMEKIHAGTTREPSAAERKSYGTSSADPKLISSNSSRSLRTAVPHD